MKYEVPFFSQYSDQIPKDWNSRACGLACLKMVLDFWKKSSVDFDSISQTANKFNAYQEGVGWIHVRLVRTATEFGLKGYNADLAFLSAEDAFQRFVNDLKIGPVIVSTFPGLDPSRVGGHMVVATAYEDDKVYVNDPEKTDTQSGQFSLSRKDFLKGWKQRYILICEP